MKLADYLSAPGAKAALARLLGVTPVQVTHWAAEKRRVPASRCIDIERVTGGLVKCEELRPDMDWTYLRGSRGRRATQELEA